MRISCPSCKAVYEVPDALIGPAPKQLRCARCAHEWLVAPPAAAIPRVSLPANLLALPPIELVTIPPPPDPPRPAPPTPEPPAPEPPAPEPQPTPRPLFADNPFRPEPAPGSAPESTTETLRAAPPAAWRSGAMLGWLLSLLAIAGLLAAAYAFRAEIMAAWPPSRRVFFGLGLH